MLIERALRAGALAGVFLLAGRHGSGARCAPRVLRGRTGWLPHRRVLADVAQDVQAALASHFEISSVGTGPDAARETWHMMEADGGQDVFGFGGDRALDAGPEGEARVSKSGSPLGHHLARRSYQKLLVAGADATLVCSRSPD